MIRSPAPSGGPWLEAGLERVRGELAHRLTGLASLNLMVSDEAAVQGKLLRPRLLLTLAAAPGERAPPPDRAAALAAAVELIHLASLHHDDVIDNSPHRRQADSVRQRLGNKVSILFGDALLAAALEVLLRCSNRRMQAALARAMTATLRGEISQHTGHRRLDLEDTECVRVASLKTGSLFGLAAKLGAMVAAEGRETAAVAYRLGRRLGTAFQLIDDALDYAAGVERLGKEPGSDYQQGIATLPLVCAWREAAPGERDILEAGFGVGGATADFAAVRRIVVGSSSFERALVAAERQLHLARGLVPSLGMPERERLIADYFQEIEARIPRPVDVLPVSARRG